MSTIRTGIRPTTFLVVTASLLAIYFGIYIYARFEKSKIKQPHEPTETQIKEFHDRSGIKRTSAKFIHFEKTPPDEADARDSISYEVIAKFESNKIEEIISDKIFSHAIETDTMPVFIKNLDLPKSDAKKFNIYHGKSPGATGLNLTLTTTNQGSFSYAYYELIILRGQMKF